MNIINAVKTLGHLPVRMKLIADKDVGLAAIEKQNVSEAVGPAVSFKVDGDLPAGWVRVSCIASSQRPANLNLIKGDKGVVRSRQVRRMGIIADSEALMLVHAFLKKDTGLSLVVEPDPGNVQIKNFTVRKVFKLEIALQKIFQLVRSGRITFKALYAIALNFLHILRTAGIKKCFQDIDYYVQKLLPKTIDNGPYEMWMKLRDENAERTEEMDEKIRSMPRRPLFSVLVPVYNVEENWLRRCIESVLAQTYPYWELCIADDASPLPHIKKVLAEYEAKDSRIKVVYRAKNGHISVATNSALSIATGDFVCLMDNDDEIAPEALFEFAQLLDRCPDTDMIYSDEDKIDGSGRRFEPFFKPDWSPEYLETCMYTAHFACYRTEIARAIGGFRKGYEGSQDHDFVLRFTEQTEKIRHIPKVLYHWRTIPGSTASYSAAKNYAVEAGIKALKDRLVRLDASGIVEARNSLPVYRCRRDVVGNPLVSIVILSAGVRSDVNGKKTALIANCVKSINKKSTYRNYEILVINNRELDEGLKRVLSQENCKLIPFDGHFDYARENNFGAKYARGEYLLFLNDDVEIISENWLEIMLGFCQRPGVGAVGARLYTNDKRIQHIGVSLDKSGMPSHLYYQYPGAITGYFYAVTGNRNCLAVTGAALMTKKTVFTEMNGFSEEFPINYNDVDYCLRLIESGKRVVYAADAELLHYESQSRDEAVSTEEEAHFRRIWGSRTERDPFYSPNLDKKYLSYEIDIS